MECPGGCFLGSSAQRNLPERLSVELMRREPRKIWRRLGQRQRQLEGMKQEGDMVGCIQCTFSLWLLLISRLYVGKNGNRKILM